MAPHPLRRLVAFLIDQMAAWALPGLLTSALHAPPDRGVQPESDHVSGTVSLPWTGPQFRPLLGLWRQTCYPWHDEGFLVSAFVALPEGTSGKVTDTQDCDRFLDGVFIGAFQVITVALTDGRPLVMATPALPMPRPAPDLLAALCLVISSWFCLVIFGSTPGKALVRLRVSGGLLPKALHETIRTSPVLCALLLGEVASPGLAISAGLALMMGLSFLARRAVMPWDRIAGTSIGER